jgi:uncharacterized membrane protein
MPNGDLHSLPLFVVGKVGMTERGSPKLLVPGHRNNHRIAPQPTNHDIRRMDLRETGHVQRMVIMLHSYGAWIVAAAFSVSGVIHMFDPKEFTPIVPQFLPFSTGLVYASGVAELICAYGLWRRQRWAGIAATALLLAIWPANLQAAVTAQKGDDLSNQVISWIRFPLQIPLIWLALRLGRSTAAASYEPGLPSPFGHV